MVFQVLRAAPEGAGLGQFVFLGILEDQPFDWLWWVKSNWKQSTWFFTQKSHPSYIEDTHKEEIQLKGHTYEGQNPSQNYPFFS